MNFFLFGSVCADESLEVLVPLIFLGFGFWVFGFFGFFVFLGEYFKVPPGTNGLYLWKRLQDYLIYVRWTGQIKPGLIDPFKPGLIC